MIPDRKASRGWIPSDVRSSFHEQPRIFEQLDFERESKDQEALSRISLAPLRACLAPILESGEAATCPILDLEVLRRLGRFSRETHGP